MAELTAGHTNNTQAGRSLRVIVQAQDVVDERFRGAVEHVRGLGHTVGVRVCWELEDVQRYVDEAVADRVDVVVAAGGDGTIHVVLNALVKPPAVPPCALGILPLGTGNDLATCCDFSCGDPLTALQVSAEAVAVPIDVLQIGNEVAINMVTGGIGPRVTHETSEVLKSLLGKAAYVISGIQHIVDLETERAEIIAPEFQWEGAFYVLALGNGRMAGGGMQLCPKALLDDGLIDLFIVPEMPLTQLASALADIRRGTQLTREDVISRQVSEVQIRAAGPLMMNADGEPFAVSDGVVRVLPRYLPMMLPSTAPLVATAASGGAEAGEPC
ncbi:MAG: lipid kinase YegS [Herpetosiphon sp.]